MFTKDTNLVVSAGCLAISLNNSKSREYINRGFIVRFFSIQLSKNELIKLFDSQGEEPLSPLVLIKPTLFLNSFYYNILGAFNNIAWAIKYEYCIFDSITEDSGNLYKINLFNDDFLGKIKCKNFELFDCIIKYKSLSKELKNLRDPTAHRIPLNFITSMLDNDDIQEYNKLMEEYNDIWSSMSASKDFTEIDDLLKKINFIKGRSP